MKKIHWFFVAILACALLSPPMAKAHAVLVASMPSIHGTIAGPDVAVRLKFNSRIDGAHSRLLLADAAGKTQPLVMLEQKAPDTLEAQKIHLSAGNYKILWQALAADGHITRGEIAFTVR
jgi:copper resistance protein C